MKKRTDLKGLIILSLIFVLSISLGLITAKIIKSTNEFELAKTYQKFETPEPIPLLPETTTTIETIETEQTEELTEEYIDIYAMDVWELGEYLYGISYLDTSRSLRLITYEDYGYTPLSYYVACCCWVRATEGYWGYGNLYSAFGEADVSYDIWMDSLGIADYAYDYLWECYIDPTYVCYCNGMTVPSDYIYYQDGIYVWN